MTGGQSKRKRGTTGVLSPEEESFQIVKMRRKTKRLERKVLVEKLTLLNNVSVVDSHTFEEE